MRAADSGDGVRFAYDPAVLRYGAGAVGALGEELAAQGYERALVVTGETVGTTTAVMEPVREGLDDRLADVFAETTPEKRLSTAIDGAGAAEAADADVLVAVGGGSSLDTAKAVAAIAASDQATAAAAAEFADTETLQVPDDALPIVAVPTTFAGADQSQGAGLTASPAGGLVDEPVDGGIWHEALHPVAAVYDPELFATTPRGVLAGSAMNGFDKGLETLYSRHATPVTDATAARGIARFREGLLAFRDDHRDGLPAAVEGLLLVQYGISRADATTLGPIHAFGQAVSASADVHQGVAHAVVAPHVLSAVFEAVDGRRELFAAALGAAPGGATTGDGAATGSGAAAAAGATAGAGAPASDVDRPDDETASAVVDAVVEIRDALGVPTHLRDLDGCPREAFEEVARGVAMHRFLDNGPRGFDPTPDRLAAVLERAW